METNANHPVSKSPRVRISRTRAVALAFVGAFVLFLFYASPGPWALGWYDVTNVERYGEMIAWMPSELTCAMPKSIPANASGTRMHCHAGYMQARTWVEIRFVVPVEDAKKIEDAATKVEADIGKGGWNLERSWLRNLATLDDQDPKTLPPGTTHAHVLALQDKRLGITAVAVDTTTGEVVYWIAPD